ncbi:calpain-like cysteine peptidase [Angomonas deanei]|uniref:Calpain large subunit, domain III, putative n=1 Tax=Angomonas deanei TaxID=59799 RepID=A0A7G2CGC1_9TRYP|nr:calpain-like cysteine peptidase [Angomonas deanei]CAD2218077.1 Calpain large subunit, domain III, putative [Angomonas deanei]|eukprot:EPY21044.1 calpain-like cysteine peptidase [Angomonas deanei]
MADFTGGIPIRRCIHGNKEHGEFDSSEWWEILLELIGKGKNSVAVVRSRGAGDVLPGIEEHHTYQLVQTLQVNGVRLVELVNHCPHDPTSGWRGDWSEVSNLWSDFPDVEDYVLGLRGASGKRRTTASMSETAVHDETKKPFASNFMLNHSTISKPTFWMAYATFLQAFEQIHLCRLFPSTYMERKVDGEWNYLSSGGSIECPTWYRNPHYHLQIYRRTFFFINLSLPDSRFTERENEAIGFDLLQDNYFPLSASETERTNKILFSTRHRHGGVISFEGMLAPSDVYWFVPSCEEVGAFSSFTVRLFSEGSFSMTKEVMEDYYNMIHTSADVPASGPFKFGEGNAQITLVVGSSRFLQPSGSGVTPTDAQPNDDEESMSRLSARARSSATGRSQTLLDGGDDKAEHRLVIRACCNPRANSRTPTNKSVALFLNEGVSILSDDGETTYGRSLGPLDKKLYAESPHVFGNTVYLTHSPVMTYDTFTVTCCPQPEGSAASVELTAWVSTPLQLKSFALPFWKKTLFPVEWLEGSCSYYETSIIQPQLEIFPQESYERMVIRMDLVESSIPSPALMLIVLANGQLGEPIRGRIPKEHVVSQSEYTSERWVQCEVDIQIEDEVESLLIIPCLQPVGTKGKCIITVLREEEVKGRVLNQR